MQLKTIKKDFINITLTGVAYICYYIFKYLVPLKVASKIGYYFGYYILSKINLTKKPIYLKNIAYVCPNKTPEEVFQIYRLSCCNFLQNLFELPQILQLDKYVQLNDPYNLYSFICNPKNPILLFTGHFGNWEIISLKFMHTTGYGIYKSPKNKYIEKLFLKLRLQDNKNIKFKMLSLNKPTTLKIMNEAKNRKLRLAMLVDQKIYEGLLVDFLGMPGYTSHFLPMLAIKYNIPLIPIKVTRDFNSKSLKFILSIEKPLNLDNFKNTSQDLIKSTEMMNSVIGKWIKEDPTQWLWLHNRW